MYSSLTRSIFLLQLLQRNSLFYLKRDFSFSFFFPISLFNDGHNKRGSIVAMFCFKLNWGGRGGVRRLTLENPFSWRKVQTSNYRLFFPPPFQNDTDAVMGKETVLILHGEFCDILF